MLELPHVASDAESLWSFRQDPADSLDLPLVVDAPRVGYAAEFAHRRPARLNTFKAFSRRNLGQT